MLHKTLFRDIKPIEPHQQKKESIHVYTLRKKKRCVQIKICALLSRLANFKEQVINHRKKNNIKILLPYIISAPVEWGTCEYGLITHFLAREGVCRRDWQTILWICRKAQQDPYLLSDIVLLIGSFWGRRMGCKIVVVSWLIVYTLCIFDALLNWLLTKN